MVGVKILNNSTLQITCPACRMTMSRPYKSMPYSFMSICTYCGCILPDINIFSSEPMLRSSVQKRSEAFLAYHITKDNDFYSD